MGHIVLVEDEPGAVALIRRYISKYASEHDFTAYAKAAEEWAAIEAAHFKELVNYITISNCCLDLFVSVALQ